MDLFGSNALFCNVKPNDALVGIFLSSFQNEFMHTMKF